ncbi:UNVERIFIED_CONTAM: Clathrin interactor EPSIN 1 [Sesamum radiatum]|uniref:Clathrin interactor EPSIN 1 n=1 Tax=Sesamum radiatum TaxID=300843 RepID=A0AAW2TW78_SESRA
MDFMKVFGQTVREIKREVNLKVLKVPELEQKVLDATDDAPWGPHGTVLAEIAQATKKLHCLLVAHGSERAIDDIIEHTFQISFRVCRAKWKDVGINVRKKAETIVKLLNDKDKIQEVRDKAAANREKYFGLSSSGITYKSGAASFSSTNFKSSDRYGGFGNSGDSETFRDSYKDRDRYGEDKYEKTSKSKEEPPRHGSNEQESPASGASRIRTNTSKPDEYASVPSQNASSANYDEDDDFDPRGNSSSKPSPGSNQVDLFGQNFVDLLDAPVSVPSNKSTLLGDDPSEGDLFADADFVSATPKPEAGESPVPHTNFDPFASQSSPAVSTTMDFFAVPGPASQPDKKASKSDGTSTAVDPFAAVPLTNFDGSDPFGSFTSHTDPSPTVSNKSFPSDGSHGNTTGSSTETKPTPKKEGFQVKSGIWADSLSRGLIDLNITAPAKKVNLADVGIVGGLTDGSEEKDKGPLPPFYMGQAMGVGSGIGKSGFTSTSKGDDFFSSLGSQQYQYGGFQK